MQAVDEPAQKVFSIHTSYWLFPQVSGIRKVKTFCCPQLCAQAVHKQEAVVHKLSTGPTQAGLVPGGSGDNVAGYRTADDHIQDALRSGRQRPVPPDAGSGLGIETAAEVAARYPRECVNAASGIGCGNSVGSC